MNSFRRMRPEWYWTGTLMSLWCCRVRTWRLPSLWCKFMKSCDSLDANVKQLAAVQAATAPSAVVIYTFAVWIFLLLPSLLSLAIVILICNPYEVLFLLQAFYFIILTSYVLLFRFVFITCKHMRTCTHPHTINGEEQTVFQSWWSNPWVFSQPILHLWVFYVDSDVSAVMW